jgi:hypothetical protein
MAKVLEVLLCVFVGILLIYSIVGRGYIPFGPPPVLAQSKDQCKIYYDKAKELAEESVEPLPPGQTVDFDPRIAKSNSSIAYSQIYRNCKKYGE